jgi:hypothetical protein
MMVVLLVCTAVSDRKDSLFTSGVYAICWYNSQCIDTNLLEANR